MRRWPKRQCPCKDFLLFIVIISHPTIDCVRLFLYPVKYGDKRAAGILQLPSYYYTRCGVHLLYNIIVRTHVQFTQESLQEFLTSILNCLWNAATRAHTNTHSHTNTQSIPHDGFGRPRVLCVGGHIYIGTVLGPRWEL
jgi:hypothetical protein